MANHCFSIDITTDPKILLDHAKKVFAEAKGSLEGDERTGQFKGISALGVVAGRYTVQNKTIQFEITKKPMLISNSLIENKIRHFFSLT